MPLRPPLVVPVSVLLFALGIPGSGRSVDHPDAVSPAQVLLDRLLAGSQGGVAVAPTVSTARERGALAERLVGPSNDPSNGRGARPEGRAPLRAPRRVQALYKARGYRPLWNTPALVLSIRAALLDARHDGLSSEELIGPAATDPFEPASASFDVQRELLLSDTLFTLLDRLANGRADARELAPESDEQLAWRDVQTTDITAVAEIETGADLHALIELARPDTALYRRLRGAMAAERERRTLPAVGAGPTLEAGSDGPRVRRLRARLLPEGDLRWVPHEVAERWDTALQAAVSAFQARNGLAVDGKVGRVTRARLDVSAAARIDALRINLERARWQARALGSEDRVIVNIPDYTLSVHLDGELAWRTPVVVGRRENRTPVFASRLDSVVLDPTWTVPRSIVAESLYAEARADPAAFAAKGYRLRSPDGVLHDPTAIDWRSPTPADFDYWVVQSPGAGNALGSVKFLFDNPYSVYLHDTPAKRLFSSHQRAYSHGCVRVQDPHVLESLLLRERASLGQPEIDTYRRRGDNVTLALHEPIAIGLLYWTADVDERGRLRLLPDVYGRDAAILATLPPWPGRLPADPVPRGFN